MGVADLIIAHHAWTVMCASWKCSLVTLHWTVTRASWNARWGLNIYWWLFFEFHNWVNSAEESQMASKENKRKYANEEEDVSTAMSNKWRAFGDDSDDNSDSSSSEEEEVSSEEEPARWACFNDGDTTDSENNNDKDKNDGSDRLHHPRLTNRRRVHHRILADHLPDRRRVHVARARSSASAASPSTTGSSLTASTEVLPTLPPPPSSIF
jgi:hypothetical protein